MEVGQTVFGEEQMGTGREVIYFMISGIYPKIYASYLMLYVIASHA